MRLNCVVEYIQSLILYLVDNKQSLGTNKIMSTEQEEKTPTQESTGTSGATIESEEEKAERIFSTRIGKTLPAYRTGSATMVV